MKYAIPALTFLVDRVKNVRLRYVNNNPERLELINILEAFISSIEIIMSTNKNDNEEELKQIAFGAWLFCLESVNVEYKWLSPERSSLYRILFEELGFSENGNPDHFDTLTCLGKFFHCLTNENWFKNQFDAKKLPVDSVVTKLKNNIQAVFNHVSIYTESLLKAIPTEKSIDEKLAILPKDYEARVKENNKSINRERLYLAQLGKALGEVMPARQTKEETRQFFSRSQRIKMGALLQFMKSIKDTYKLRSPRGNSELYDLCCEILNVDDIDDVDKNIQLDCVTAYETFINDNKCVAELEKSIQNQKDPCIVYIDRKLRQNKSETSQMIKELLPHGELKISPMTQGVSSLFKLMCAAPGYGAGYVIGESVGLMSDVIKPKIEVSNVTNQVLTLMIGDAGKYLAYYSADKIVNATLERAAAKVFEWLAMLVGSAAGGAIGIVIFDFSFHTLANLIKLCLYLYENLDPKLVKNFDSRVVECLAYLPSEVFTEEQKAKVASITKGTFFDPLSTATKNGMEKVPLPEFPKQKTSIDSDWQTIEHRLVKSLTS